MRRKLTLLLALVLTIYSCNNDSQHNEKASNVHQNSDLSKLKKRAIVNLDSCQWNKELLQQDIESYSKYSEIFEQYPLNNYAFPVADYDYAVYSNPFTIKYDSLIFKGIQVGEYINPDSDSIVTKMTLIVLTNDNQTEPETFVSSRNFPYLTAEGTFNLPMQNFAWVFQATPDGFSSLFFSMKLFDLRFGQTIVIYPKKDKSFLYEQLEESPDRYSKFENYTISIMKNKKHLIRLKQLQ
ncbi:hypothetical protein [Faecalibacter bovis]|uniref:DUF4825 domain-containing protein n=1 Tax=Faecalibacter bovis TaxID=2898187 RepID=A0ABX7XB14_9FLAO|nr:hypothetical protein [Faecalibacter bovis]QTV05085.1 hypothetical protein J9309_09820 [Faecalibacter bovis]